MVSLHHEQFVCQDLRLSLVDDAPGILRIASHHIIKRTPEVFGLLRSCCGRRSGKLSVLGLNRLGAVTRSFQLLLTFVHGVRTFRTEKLQRVIAEHIGIGQNLVVSQVLLVLIDREVGVALNRLSGPSAPRDGAVQHLLQV